MREKITKQKREWEEKEIGNERKRKKNKRKDEKMNWKENETNTQEKIQKEIEKYRMQCFWKKKHDRIEMKSEWEKKRAFKAIAN